MKQTIEEAALSILTEGLKLKSNEIEAFGYALAWAGFDFDEALDSGAQSDKLLKWMHSDKDKALELVAKWKSIKSSVAKELGNLEKTLAAAAKKTETSAAFELLASALNQREYGSQDKALDILRSGEWKERIGV